MRGFDVDLSRSQLVHRLARPFRGVMRGFDLWLGRLLKGNSEACVQPGNSSGDVPRELWPVFIVSSLRSGSTLLRYLLDGHENLACPPESKFIAVLQDVIDYPQVLPALRSLGLSTAEIHRKMRSLIESILGDYAARRNKRRWVDKTPSYYRILPFLEQVFEEKVLYVFLVRHPLDCIGSLEAFLYPSAYSEDPDVRRNVLKNGKGRYGWAKYWMEVYERIYIFAKAHPDRSHLLKYEDLVATPQGALSSVLSFLGESYSRGLERRAFRHLHRGGYQDTKIFRTKGIHRRSIGKWREWPKPEIEALWELTQPIASKYGYDDFSIK